MSWLLGRRRTLGRARTEAALDFGLDVAAKRFRHNAGSGKFAKVGNGELWQVGKNGGQWHGRLAQKRDADVVGDGPFAVMNDGGNHGRGKFFSRESFQDLRFRQMEVVENDGDNLRMALRQQRSGNSRRATARQSDFLA